MRSDDDHPAAQSAPVDMDSGSTEWLDHYPSTTVRAVDPNEVTAGLDVTLYDLDSVEMPFMVVLDQHFPPEDDVEGESVAIYGEHAVLQTIAALAELVSGRYDDVPWPEEDLGGDGDDG